MPPARSLNRRQLKTSPDSSAKRTVSILVPAYGLFGRRSSPHRIDRYALKQIAQHIPKAPAAVDDEDDPAGLLKAILDEDALVE